MPLNFLNTGYFSDKVGIGINSPTTSLHVIGIAQIVTGSNTAFYEGASVRMFGAQNYSFRSSGGNTRAVIDVNATGVSAGNLSLYNASSVVTNYINNAGDSFFNGGNVGIGTTTPLAKLDIQGTLGQLFSVTDNLSGKIFAVADISGVPIMSINSNGLSTFSSDVTITNGQLTVTHDSNNVAKIVQTAISMSNATYTFEVDSSSHNSNMSTAGAMAVDVNSGRAFTINGLGNVGIGTDSPYSKLQVGNPASTTQTMLTIASMYTATPPALNFRSAHPSNSNVWNMGQIRVDDDGNYNGVMEFLTTTSGGNSGTQPTIKMVLKANGYFGIGTTTPKRILDVNVGTASGVGASFAGTISAGEYQGIHFGYSEAGNANYRKSALVFERDDAGIGDATGKIHILNNAQNGSNSATLADSRVTILKNGNVGIGNTAPTYRLVLGGNGSLDDSIKIGTYQVAKDTRQYIGYTRADTGLFESSGSGDTPSTVLSGVAGIRISNTAGSLSSSNADNSVQLITHIYNGGSRVALHAAPNGNIGIGTTSPTAATLTVAGTGNFTGLVSGITPTAAANFVTKAYADALTPGVGVFLPIANPTFTGTLQGPNIISTAGNLQSKTTTADAYTPAAFNDKPLLVLRNADGNTNYAGIQFSNNSGTYEWFQGAVQTTATRAEYVFQGYDGVSVYKEHLRIKENSDVIFVGKLSIGHTAAPVQPVDVRGAGTLANFQSSNGYVDLKFINSGATSFLNFAGTGFNIYQNGGSSTNITLAISLTAATFRNDVIVKTALLSNQENTTVDTGTETVAQVPTATYTAAFFDFVIKKGLNVRSGTVYACHDGDTTPLIQFTETSTQDLGDTSDVVLTVDYSSPNMRLQATVASDGWSIKSLIRAI